MTAGATRAHMCTHATQTSAGGGSYGVGRSRRSAQLCNAWAQGTCRDVEQRGNVEAGGRAAAAGRLQLR